MHSTRFPIGLAVVSCLAGPINLGFAQCGVLLQESLTIPDDVEGFRSSSLYDPDGPGPLPDILLLGADKGRVFAYDGVRFRQFGSPMLSQPDQGWSGGDPFISELVTFRGQLYAVVSNLRWVRNGSLFRWEGFDWIQIPNGPACGGASISGGFRAAAVYGDEIIVAGEGLSCGDQPALALAWNGSSWRAVGDMPFSDLTSTTRTFAIYADPRGRLLLGGAWSNGTFEGPQVKIVELVGDRWESRLERRWESTYERIAAFVRRADDLLAVGRVTPSIPGGPQSILQETSTGWVAAEPFRSALAPISQTGASSLLLDGDRSLVADQAFSARSGIVVLDPLATTVSLPDDNSIGYIAKLLRYQDHYLAIGLQASSALKCAQKVLFAHTSSPHDWRTLPPLLAAPANDSDGLGTVASAAGQVVVAQGSANLRPRVPRPSSCTADPSTSLLRSPDRWIAPADQLDQPARSLVVYRNQIVAVGSFTFAGPRSLTRGLALWDGQAWQPFDAPIPASSFTITSAAASQDSLLVATRDGGTASVWEFRDGTWTRLGSPFATTTDPLLAADDGRIALALGNRVWEWDEGLWVRRGTDASTPWVTAIVFHENSIVVGTPQLGTGIQRWDGTAWTLVGAVSDVPGHVLSLAVHNGELFAGLMKRSGNPTANPLIKFSQGRWISAAQAPPLVVLDRASHGTIWDLHSDGDTLHIVGIVRQLGGLPFEAYATFYSGPPRYYVQPVPSFTRPGDTAYFSIEPEVHHDPNQTYAWHRDGQPLVNGPTPSGSTIQGAATPFLRILNISAADIGAYDLILSNACGQSTSTPARLAIRCPADLDNGSNAGTPDGTVTIDDLLYFLEAFSQGTPAADLDNGSNTGTPDGAATLEDLLYFLARYDAGC